MHYLVTGGAGFIGSHLCETLLGNGHEVTVLDDFSTGKYDNVQQGVRCIRGDAADPDCVTPLMDQCDGIFHLAAIASVEMSRRQWRATTNANLMATVTLLDAISKRDAPIPFVYASSAAIYGDNPNIPLSEGDYANPLTPYGVDKYASELHARTGTLIHGIPTSGMRFFNVYGPRQDPHSPYSGVISIFAARLLAKQDITIFGDGGQSRDFIYVADVVAHLIAAMEQHHASNAPHAAIFNVCGGQETSIAELAALLAELTEQPNQPHYGEARYGDIYRSLGDTAYASEMLHYHGHTSLRDGLTNTLEWMKKPEALCA